MDIWKEMNKDRIKRDDFVAFIEIEQGGKNKYELDKETSLIILDRVLFTATYYPMNYGFIPRTLSEDNDPLDVFVMCSQPIEKMSLVRCYPIGVIKMIDGNELDQKIIAIPFGDPQNNGYTDISELPEHIFDELIHFLKVYKQLEGKPVEIESIKGQKEAMETIDECLLKFENEIENKDTDE
ncbi:MAG: inorganic diphosphatase [Clostridia bacterium]|nr:inorganic diphosphatase [Clostridia bacterium]